MTTNIHFLSGLEQAKQGNFQEAIVFFSKSLALEPQHKESYFNRALARYQLQDFKNALKDFDEALNLSPKDAAILHERAITYHKLGNHREALQDLDLAIKHDAQNPYRYSSRAYIRAFVGDVQGGIDDYQQAILLDPEDVIALNNLGLLEEKLGYKDKAKAHFERADDLADAGKQFDKPDLDTILKEFEEKQQARLETERLLKQPKGTGENLSSKADQDSISAYWNVIKGVFSSKETFKEFTTFLKNPFQKNK